MKDEERKTGRSWRILVKKEGAPDAEISNEGVFDELVLDRWLHLEWMEGERWWIRIGDARVLVDAAVSDGVIVDVERGFYDEIRGRTETRAEAGSERDS